MCNIAGYVGDKQAAPILLEMLKKQEGFDAGFYTGIATIHEGKIYYAKVVGDTDTLIQQTNAASLPGTIGIAHSRTPGGADEENKWAHPFTTEKNGQVRIAQVLNGWVGCWTYREPEYLALGKQLMEEGYPLKSAIHAPGKHWSIDGSTSVHTSDIFTQVTAKHMDQGADAVSALQKRYDQMPEETDLIASGRIGIITSRIFVFGSISTTFIVLNIHQDKIASFFCCSYICHSPLFCILIRARRIIKRSATCRQIIRKEGDLIAFTVNFERLGCRIGSFATAYHFDPVLFVNIDRLYSRFITTVLIVITSELDYIKANCSQSIDKSYIRTNILTCSVVRKRRFV